ncbi:MAG TPA: glycerol-3-phosphate acyltransferase [Anaerolineales bacterium]|jgi:glycerol-3-phosphate acyltransferase PlsY|nr:glycerol-3-phosphate acyltransferase [Anaerolineales bacterium]
MKIWLSLLAIALGYLLGSVPTGLLIVKFSTGKDVRGIASGRTGGTNAMRAAGFWAGLGTAIADLLKAAAAAWIARGLVPDGSWVHMLAPLGAIAGHNYSIFLLKRDQTGRLQLAGGAGGAPTVGGAFGLWPFSILIIVPLAALILYFVGYASIATISVALIATLIFAYRAWIGVSPWQYILYGVLAEILLLWALRPNIRRLSNGNERLMGFRARHPKKASGQADASHS